MKAKVSKLTQNKEITVYEYPTFVVIAHYGYPDGIRVIKRDAFAKRLGSNPDFDTLDTFTEKFTWCSEKREIGRWVAPSSLEKYAASAYGDDPHWSYKEPREPKTSDIIDILDSGDYSGLVFGQEYDGLLYDLNDEPFNRILHLDIASFAFTRLEALADKLRRRINVISSEYYSAHCSDCGDGVKLRIRFSQEELRSLITEKVLRDSPYEKNVIKLLPELGDHLTST